MAEDILEKLAAYARVRVEKAKKEHPLEEVKQAALAMDANTGFPFEKALATEQMSFICECKKASPSKGLIAPDFPYLDIARQYEAAGASAISVLTEPKWFLGSDDYLKEITAEVQIPCLRKDFTVDDYMIYEARILGASAVLLICAITDTDTLRHRIQLCDSLGLSALVEAHDQAEIESAVSAGARIIGVNNRNLRDFTVDIHNSIRLRQYAPSNVLFVAESGIHRPEDVEEMRRNGVNAVLIGEQLMRAESPAAELARLRGDGPVRIKMCGMRRPEDIEAVNAIKPAYVGFIFDKTKRRYVAPEEAETLRQKLVSEIQSVGVFVNASVEKIRQVLAICHVDLVQLHGQESNAFIGELRSKLPEDVKIIKAFTVRTPEDVMTAEQSAADYILLDNGTGTGETFDWSLLSHVNRPFFLAGGLNPGNVAEAIEAVHPFAVDVSSGIETDGVKNLQKMQAFADNVRSR